MKTTAIVEMWDDMTISIYVPDFDGFNLSAQGRTLPEAKAALHDAVEDYKAALKADGRDIPPQLARVEFEYKYDMASFFECFKFINVSSFARYAGINPSLMRQYKQRLAFASEKQKDKIEKAIHMAGHDMLAAKF